MKALVCACAVGALSLLSANAPAQQAQQFPGKPIRFVVPYPPGGGTDGVGRIVSQQLTSAFGQQTFVDNKSGGQGILGVRYVATSAPDGYTLILADTGNFAVAPWTTKDLGYHPLRDFAFVSSASSQGYLIVAHPSVQVRTLKELVAVAKARPGALSFGSTSQANQLAGEYLNMLAGINILHVPYKGAGPAITDLLGGQISLSFGSAAGTAPHVRTGKLNALAITSTTRASNLPEVPTAQEAGFPDLVVTSWYGVAAPAKTPADIVAKLNINIVQALRQPEVIAQISKFGLTAEGSSPEEFTRYVKAEYERWGIVIDKVGMGAK